jgi:transposase
MVKPLERPYLRGFAGESGSCPDPEALVDLGPMNWKRMLAHVTGSFDQELLLRNQYLATENRILRRQIKGRVLFSDPERLSLARIAKQLSRKALEEIAQIVRPETILAWHRRLMAKKFDGSRNRSTLEPRSKAKEIEELVLRFAQENRAWGYRRIVGALSNLGHQVSHQTVANVLKRHGLEPAPERQKKTTWKEFIRYHMEVLAAVDFFTVEVWTGAGLLTYYVLTFLRVASRQVCILWVAKTPSRGKHTYSIKAEHDLLVGVSHPGEKALAAGHVFPHVQTKEEPSRRSDRLLRARWRRFLSSCLTQVTMMEAANQGRLDDFAAVGWFDRPRHGTIVVKGSMWANFMVIFEIRFEKLPQLPFIEPDHSIQAFTPN